MAFTLAGCCCSVLSVQPQTVQRSWLPRTLRTSAKTTEAGKAFNSGPGLRAWSQPKATHTRHGGSSHSHIFLRCRPDETCKTLQTTGRVVWVVSRSSAVTPRSARMRLLERLRMNNIPSHSPNKSTLMCVQNTFREGERSISISLASGQWPLRFDRHSLASSASVSNK